jgi:hypothetical protein
LCVCPGPSNETCRAGEVCVKTGIIDHDCSCNGGSSCSGGQVCCQTPAGCVNLTNNAQNCGACGHTCPPGFSCGSSVCVCGGDTSCNAGSAGTCVSGNCVCGGNTCVPGQRCLPNGSCG